MQLTHAGKVCDKDRFDVTDGMSGGLSMGSCVLGLFKPVTKSQVEEIEERLEIK
jgi:hypothetical protein